MVLCKFFAHGACLKGENCEFSHDWKEQPNNICTFYQKGVCNYGTRCRYQHVRPSKTQSHVPSSSTNPEHSSMSASNGLISASSKPFFPPNKPAWSQGSRSHDPIDETIVLGPTSKFRPSDLPICSFAAAGDCPRGENCPQIHGDLCSTCGKRCLHPFRPEEREEHMKTCNTKQKYLEALKRSQEIECSVCLDRVLSKPSASERKFGLLSECDHPFCVSCIRNWRSSSPTSGMDVNSALRACPICRKLSYFVIPSVIWYSTSDEKQEIVDSYKSRLRSIDCRYFDFGNGACPFGTSCFYKHTVRPGSHTWITGEPLKYENPSVADVANMDSLLEGLLEYIEEELEDFNEDLNMEGLTPDELESFMNMSLGMSELSSEDDVLESSSEEI